MNTKLYSSGYENSTAAILPGLLQAEIRSASSLWLTLCKDAPISFGSLELDIGNLYYLCESEVSKEFAKVSHRLKIPTDLESVSLEAGCEDAVIYDAACESAIFTRCVNTKEDISFKLSLPNYCKAYYYKTYKLSSRALPCVMIVASKGAPTLDGSFLQEDKRMLILLCGNVTFDKTTGKFNMRQGYSALAFVAADLPSLSSLGEKAFYYVWTKSEKYLSVIKNTVTGLDCRVINDSVFSSSCDRRIYVEDLPDTVRAFLQSNDVERAQKQLLAMQRLSENGQKLCPRYPQADESIENASSAVYLIYSVMIYHNYTKDDKFVSKLYEMLKNAMTAALDGVKDNMLAEIPTSPLYENDTLSENSRYHGSAVTTAMCIDAFYWLHDFFKKHVRRLEKASENIQNAANEMLKSFEENFVYKDKIYHSSPKREDALRRTRFAFGRCVGCKDKSSKVFEGMLERTNKGVYLCPACYENASTYIYERAKRVFTPTAVAMVARSSVIREYIGDQRLLEMLWMSFEAYKNKPSLRTVKEDAYMLECAVLLDKEKQADLIYKVIKENADALGRYTKFCDANGAVGSDFHSGSCAAVYCALERYRQYKKDLTDMR